MIREELSRQVMTSRAIPYFNAIGMALSFQRIRQARKVVSLHEPCMEGYL